MAISGRHQAMRFAALQRISYPTQFWKREKVADNVGEASGQSLGGQLGPSRGGIRAFFWEAIKLISGRHQGSLWEALGQSQGGLRVVFGRYSGNLGESEV